MQNSIKALSFDTTAVNSGRLGGRYLCIVRKTFREKMVLFTLHTSYIK